MNVLVTGSLGYDYIMDFSGRFAERIMPDKIHKISFAPLVDNLKRQFGGTAGNIAFTLKLLGTDPYILSTSGSDFIPYLEHLKQHHISIKYVKQNNRELTGTYFVVTDRDDNQIGAFYIGANIYNDLLNIPDGLQFNFCILSPNKPAAMLKFASQCTKRKIPYMFDPAFQINDFSKNKLIKCINNSQIFIGNDYEVALVEKRLGMQHEDLLELSRILITTLGNKGSIIESRIMNNGSWKKIQIRPAKPKNTSDPTGAGDAYRAGFLAGYLRGFDLNICGQMGSVAAVYTVETYGTQTHQFTLQEFCQRYKVNFGEELNL